MKYLFAITIGFLLCTGIKAQQVTWGENFTNRGVVTQFNSSDSSVKGSPYVESDFLLGKISIGNESKVYQVRFNAYDDIIEIKNESDDTVALSDKITDVSIKLVTSNKIYKPYFFIDPDTNELAAKKGYFVVVEESGETALLIKERIIYIEAKEAISGYDRSKPAEFKRASDKFYTLNDNGEAVIIPKNKKDLANLFPKYSKDILSYIKSNKIKTNKKEDLVLLVNYINSIKETN